MSKKQDGGLWALAGYLYQVVGTLSIPATIPDSTLSIQDHDRTDALLELTKVGEALCTQPEQYGQDVVLDSQFDPNDECVLVQFKYSLDKRPIGVQELRETIERLDESAKRAEADGKRVTSYMLVTNRPLTGTQKGAAYYWDEQKRERDPHCVLRYVPCSMEEFEERIRRFGQAYGATDKEIERGINSSIGKVFRETGDHRFRASVFKEDLIEAFTDYRDSRALTPENVTEHSRRQLCDFGTRIGLRGNPVRRQVLSNLVRDSTGRALIILYGLGGCGKTVALWQWISEAGAFTTFSTAKDIPTRDWVVREICEWSNLPDTHNRRNETTEEALNRLFIANPDLNPPIFHLGLDGLDEEHNHPEQRYSASNAIKWFWEEDSNARGGHRPPRAVLVVTCRDAEEFKRSWLPHDLSGGFSSLPAPVSHRVEVFSLDEMHDALNITSLDQSVRDRIETTINIISDYEAAVTLRSSNLSGRIADEGIVDSIRHPSVWRSFLELNTSTQQEVLDGDSAALNRLAHLFVGRFCGKVIHRGKIISLRENELLGAIYAVARQSELHDGIWHLYREDWEQPSVDSAFVNERQARDLYYEALSGGLIAEDTPNRWRWLYPWIQDYLAKGVSGADDE